MEESQTIQNLLIQKYSIEKLEKINKRKLEGKNVEQQINWFDLQGAYYFLEIYFVLKMLENVERTIIEL